MASHCVHTATMLTAVCRLLAASCMSRPLTVVREHPGEQWTLHVKMSSPSGKTDQESLISGLRAKVGAWVIQMGANRSECAGFPRWRALDAGLDHGYGKTYKMTVEMSTPEQNVQSLNHTNKNPAVMNLQRK